MARSADERRGEAPARGNSASPPRSKNDLGDVVEPKREVVGASGGPVIGKKAGESEKIRTINFPNGDVYEGELKDGKPHGKGVCRFEDGRVYDGELKDGKRHGRGVYRYANGAVYDGEWKNEKRHGRGVYRDAHGGVYDGDWKGDKRHGRGIYRLASYGVMYDGDWEDDKLHGTGTRTFVSGDVCEGEFKEGKEHGKGTYKWKNGDIYEGDFRDGKKHGKGTMKYSSGEVYDGEWKDGMRHGWGRRRDSSQNVYEGQWVEGREHGKGKLIGGGGRRGKVFEAQWAEGKPHGKCTLKFSAGDIYEGVWTDGHVESKGKMKWANGDIQTGCFVRPGGCKLRSHRSQQRRLQAARKTCEHCGLDDYRFKLRVCTGCGLALYCSIACQQAARGSHQRICSIISQLPSKDADKLLLRFDREKGNDFDAGLRYATKYMDNLKHLVIDLEKMGQGEKSAKFTTKQLSSLLKSKKGDLHSLVFFNGYACVPGISQNGYDAWKEVHGLKQLHLCDLKFDDTRPIGDILCQQRDTVMVLSLPFLAIDWHKAKTRKTIAQAVSACKNLVKLNLDGSWLMDSDLKIVLQDLPNLRILHLSRNTEYSHEFTDNTCGLIARKCPGLQQLDLRHHDHLSVRGIRKIFEGCVHLRSFATTTCKLNCKDVQSLLDIAPQLMYLSLADDIDISEEELDGIVEATGGRIVFQVSSGGNFEPDGISAKTREKYECQKDVLSEIFSRHRDPEVSNEWVGCWMDNQTGSTK